MRIATKLVELVEKIRIVAEPAEFWLIFEIVTKPAEFWLIFKIVAEPAEFLISALFARSAI